ncbi:36920_t:CDS:2, partial [Racocetra persica]
ISSQFTYRLYIGIIMKSIVQSSFITMQKEVKTLLEQVSNNDWKLKTILLDICMLPHPYTGEEINTQLYSTLETFNITNKILCATTDGGSNIVLAMQLLKENFVLQNFQFNFQPHRCLAHILNLIVTTGLSPIKSSIEKVRNLVKTIILSSSLTQDFKELGQSVGQGETTYKILQDISTR